MKITQIGGNALYSIRFVEFFRSDGNLLDAYFELINLPFRCVGIYVTVESAKAEMERLTDLQDRRNIKYATRVER